MLTCDVCKRPEVRTGEYENQLYVWNDSVSTRINGETIRIDWCDDCKAESIRHAKEYALDKV